MRQPGQQPRLDQRRLAAARRAVDQADPERRRRGRSTRSGSSRTGGSRAGRRGRGGRGAARGRSRRRRWSNDRSPLGTTLTAGALGVGPRRSGRVGVASAVEPGGAATGPGAASVRRPPPRPGGSAAGPRPGRGPCCTAPTPAWPAPSGRSAPARGGSCRRSAGAAAARRWRSAPGPRACESPRNGRRPVSSS